MLQSGLSCVESGGVAIHFNLYVTVLEPFGAAHTQSKPSTLTVVAQSGIPGALTAEPAVVTVETRPEDRPPEQLDQPASGRTYLPAGQLCLSIVGELHIPVFTFLL